MTYVMGGHCNYCLTIVIICLGVPITIDATATHTATYPTSYFLYSYTDIECNRSVSHFVKFCSV